MMHLQDLSSGPRSHDASKVKPSGHGKSSDLITNPERIALTSQLPLGLNTLPSTLEQVHKPNGDEADSVSCATGKMMWVTCTKMS
ncbi:hypothetical protein JOB18_026287 [Solea senegalensis]|uniref:Uncharacterized protein n=1 Tax=Solea senegalensis TaxID=28829 RepID=A0AAV6R3H6_SOLSE|nr:hypothetical protein JOB18_026287 [Solea senegalensis]